jgi:hypothetical protein
VFGAETTLNWPLSSPRPARVGQKLKCEWPGKCRIMGGMASKCVDEDWAEQDLETLWEMALACIAESERCHEAGCPLAALVMLASAFEASLLGMVIAHEDALRADGAWPGAASHMHLTGLVRLAEKRGWLADESVWLAVAILNKVRTMAAHPGAYVRGIGQVPEQYDLRAPEGYAICLAIVRTASQQLSEADARTTAS